MKKILAILLAGATMISCFTGCSSKENEFEYDAKTLGKDVALALEMNIEDLAEVSEEYMDFLGVDKELYEDFGGYYAQVSTSVDLIVTVKAKDKKSAEKIVELLDARKMEMSAAQENYNKTLADKAARGTSFIKNDIYIAFAIAGSEEVHANEGDSYISKILLPSLQNAFEAQEVSARYAARKESGEAPVADN